MRQITLGFSLRGDRNYVHGTDIYKQIIKNLESVGYNNWQYFELNIKNITQNNLTCFLSDKKQRLQGEIINFMLIQDEKHVYGSLVENADEKIVLKYPFSDNEITKRCIIDREQELITYKNSQNTFTAIDIIITISKYYLENTSDNLSKWFFRTIKVFKPIDAINFQQIQMKKIMQKRNIVEFCIYMDNEIIAQGYAASIKR